MPINNDGAMIILSSPSGAGKTTLVKKLSEKDNFEISISHTTRQPRPNENRNEDYFFVDELEFKRLIKNEEFIEYAKVFNNFYGTTRTPVIDKLNKGKNVLFDIDWQGADLIKNKRLDYKLITFFILNLISSLPINIEKNIFSFVKFVYNRCSCCPIKVIENFCVFKKFFIFN